MGGAGSCACLPRRRGAAPASSTPAGASVPRLPPALLGLTLAACAPGDVPRAAESSPGSSPGSSPVVVTLGDSVAYANDMTSGVLHRVVVRAGRRTDTIPELLTGQLPIVIGDSVVHGLRAEHERVLGPFAYEVRTRRLRVLPTPPDWVPHAAPQLAPDGRHVAYLAQAPEGAGYAAVARVPDGRIVLRGPPATMRETDAGVDVIAWTDPLHVEVRIDLSAATGGTQRVRATLVPPTVVVDTCVSLDGRSLPRNEP